MKSLFAWILLMAAAPLWGEVVHLTDGSTLQGDLRRTNDGWVVTTADGKVTAINASQVKSIELRKADTAASAEDGLASLRRATANQTDPRQIIQRFQEFIAKNAGSPAAQSAQADVAQWQDRLSKGLVKAGDQWVTPAELTALQAKVLAATDRLRSLIAAGNLTLAMAGLEHELAIAPKNPSLLFLKGLIYLRQFQLVPARTAFEGVAAALPDHAPTHNNLAVILWRQNGKMQALSQYSKAMAADPQNRIVLDNITEALHALPPEHQKADLTKRVVEMYKVQESALEQTMAAKGLYRWGAEWLSAAEFNKVQAAQKIVQDKIDALTREQADVKQQLVNDANQIQNDSQAQAAMRNQSLMTDPTTGRAYYLPLPQRYYDLDREIKTLQTDQLLKQRQYLDLQGLIVQQQKNMPAKRYTGIQKPFDGDGMPGAAPATSDGTIASGPVVSAPTTAPAAAPATGVKAAHGLGGGASRGGGDFAPAAP